MSTTHVCPLCFEEHIPAHPSLSRTPRHFHLASDAPFSGVVDERWLAPIDLEASPEPVEGPRPTPAEFDKFTDDQFLAFTKAIGFDDRIKAALAEVRAERATPPASEAGLREALKERGLYLWKSGVGYLDHDETTAELAAILLAATPKEPDWRKAHEEAGGDGHTGEDSWE